MLVGQALVFGSMVARYIGPRFSKQTQSRRWALGNCSYSLQLEKRLKVIGNRKKCFVVRRVGARGLQDFPGNRDTL